MEVISISIVARATEESNTKEIPHLITGNHISDMLRVKLWAAIMIDQGEMKMDVTVLDSLDKVERMVPGHFYKLPNNDDIFVADILKGSYRDRGIYLTTIDSDELAYRDAGVDAMYSDYIKHMREPAKRVIFGITNIWAAIQSGKYYIG